MKHTNTPTHQHTNTPTHYSWLLVFLKKNLSILVIFLIVSTHFNCKKISEEEKQEVETSSSENMVSASRNTNISCDLNTTSCEDCAFQEHSDENELSESTTVLGAYYNNPYSLENMTTAFNYIYSSRVTRLTPTHKYVRFKPTNIQQLNTLDSLDIELYDYPLDRETLQEGEYWPEAYEGLVSDEMPWLYTVVETGFSFPVNIQYEVISSLYIPDDNEELEDEAYFISGNYTCDTITYKELRAQRKIYYEEFPPVDTCDCPGGGGGGSDPGNSPLKPKGQINFKTYATNSNNILGASAPLRFARIVARRFFKIDKTYTDLNGNFQLSKRFPRKVTIVVKFKASADHGQHSVRMNHINLGFWRSMFPMKKNIGTYRGNNLQNLTYEFEKGSTSIKKKTRLWLAAVIMNTSEESRSFLIEKSMNPLPDDLRTYLYTPGEQTATPQFEFIRRSNTPYLNQDRNTFNDIIDFGTTTGLAGGTIALIFGALGPAGVPLSIIPLLASFTSVPNKPDIYFFYRTSDINSLTATKVSMSIGQQLGVAYLSKLTASNPALGANRSLYISSKYYSIEHFTFNDYAPFGNNVSNTVNNYYPGVIAVWESFAQHFGNVISDRLYGTGSNEFELQGKQWVSDANKSSNLKYLEEFDPTITAPADYFNWIPVGLINDLIDNSPDQIPSLVVDNVSGFTYQEIQTALYDKPATVADFKNDLKNIKPSQSSQIDQLFTSYGY